MDLRDIYSVLGMIGLLTFSGYVSVSAQTKEPIDEDIILNQLNAQERNLILHQAGQDVTNSSIIRQIGDENKAGIKQEHTGGNEPNEVVLLQDGDGNTVDIDQRGENNTSKTIQKGDYNTQKQKVRGSDIRSVLYQEGDYNNVDQDLKGEDMHHVIIQEGDYNEVIQIEDSDKTQAPKYQLRQEGSGMKVFIKQSKIY